jgi:hypothetical protein
VTAAHVVLCTNGFVDHIVQDSDGSPIRLAADQQIIGRVAYMTAFVEDEPRPPAAMSYIRNTIIGRDTAHVYVTRRTYDRPGDTVTLTCMGGPEYPSTSPSMTPALPSRASFSARLTNRCGRSLNPADPLAVPTTSTGMG